MVKFAIIQTVLEWIESHLEQPLDVEIIAEHSGYSKRAFHDIFKSITGHNVATYVRNRRLSKSATMLLLTNKSIVDIAHKYQFETQAYYTRAFKKYFNQTPGEFRKGSLDFTQHQFPHNVLFDHNYILNSVQIPERNVEGTIYEIKLDISDIPSYAKTARDCHARVKREMSWATIHHEDVMTVISFTPMHGDYIKIKYLIRGNHSIPQKGYDSMIIEPGKYAKITFIGRWEDYDKFPSRIYAYIMRNHHLVRRDGVDFEVFHINGSCEVSVICDYYIPII